AAPGATAGAARSAARSAANRNAANRSADPPRLFPRVAVRIGAVRIGQLLNIRAGRETVPSPRRSPQESRSTTHPESRAPGSRSVPP
ncbi:MAG: hypothetical protein ACREFV_04635, partial [Acetobacteraceae bacterium]